MTSASRAGLFGIICTESLLRHRRSGARCRALTPSSSSLADDRHGVMLVPARTVSIRAYSNGQRRVGRDGFRACSSSIPISDPPYELHIREVPRRTLQFGHRNPSVLVQRPQYCLESYWSRTAVVLPGCNGNPPLALWFARLGSSHLRGYDCCVCEPAVRLSLLSSVRGWRGRCTAYKSLAVGTDRIKARGTS
jgi:hypothetical protein